MVSRLASRRWIQSNVCVSCHGAEASPGKQKSVGDGRGLAETDIPVVRHNAERIRAARRTGIVLLRCCAVTLRLSVDGLEIVSKAPDELIGTPCYGLGPDKHIHTFTLSSLSPSSLLSKLSCPIIRSHQLLYLSLILVN
uniref:Uncharacterized protein n=1 Tax=Hyaloperonospora arabidopsidis (strain Emoy2) TaxID=559515 RepID=M4B2W3_HYAAE